MIKASEKKEYELDIEGWVRLTGRNGKVQVEKLLWGKALLWDMYVGVSSPL